MEITKNASGEVVAKIKTPRGKVMVPLGTTNKRNGSRLARRARLRKLESTRLSREAITTVLVGHQVSMRTAVKQWEKQMRSEGNIQDRTIYNNVTFVNAFLRFRKLDKRSPAVVTTEDVSAWVNANDGTKASTRAVRLSILRTFFDWCSAKSYCMGNPARTIRKPNLSKLTHEQKETEYKIAFTDGEIATLQGYINVEMQKLELDLGRVDELWRNTAYMAKQIQQRISDFKFWRAAITISRWTGLRIGDVCGLEWASLSKPGVITVWTDKRDVRVEIPLNDQLSGAISRIDRVDDTFCFPRQNGINRSSKRSMIPRQFERLCRRAGVTGKSFHCLRSSAAIDMKERLMLAGHPAVKAEEIVAKLLGHSSAVTTRDHYLPQKESTP